MSQFHNQQYNLKLRTMLICATDGRFPRAWLQPPRRFAPAGSSAGASPPESPSSAPINGNPIKTNEQLHIFLHNHW